MNENDPNLDRYFSVKDIDECKVDFMLKGLVCHFIGVSK